jgi:hypothetical protein
MSTMKERVMNKTSTKYIMCHIVFQPCTTAMYINTIEYAIRYHEWSVSTICLYQHVNHVSQPSVISLMICFYHESSATTMYLNQSSIITSVSTISIHTSTSAPNMHRYLYQASASPMHQISTR